MLCTHKYTLQLSCIKFSYGVVILILKNKCVEIKYVGLSADVSCQHC